MKAKTEYQKFLDENMSIPASQDKNPMFYVFTAARLNGKKQPEELGDDWALSNIINRVEKLCREIGKPAVTDIIADFKPISIMVEMGEHKTAKALKEAIKTIFGWFRQRSTAELTKFSDYNRITTAFDDFMKSEELEEFFGTL